MRMSCYRLAGALALALIAGTALAQVPQDIVVDGVKTDWNVANLVEDDSGDTQYTEVDLGDITITNNAINLFVGYDFDTGGWANQIGIAIDVDTADGGTTDPWSRQITWANAVNKPDFVVYCNQGNNWQAGYQWSGSAWTEFVTQGPGALNWVTNTAFGEFGILLSTLGVSAGDVVGVEVWITQDNTARGGLDFAANDAVQNSVVLPFPATDWAPAAPCDATIFHNFTVLSASDVDPPVVDNVIPTAHPIADAIDVVFNEPVDQTTAETTSNYTLLDELDAPVTISTATRDASNLNVVHLVLAGPLTAADGLYDLTVAGVEDAAGNPVATGSGDQFCFIVKQLVFRGLFSYYLQNNSSPPDGFSIQGDLAPLTFSQTCDTGVMTDTGTDDIWEWSGLFMVPGDCAGDTAAVDLQWKFLHNCGTYEGLAGNRVHTLATATGAIDTLEFWWNDEDPTNFLATPVDVEFFVDMNASAFAPGDTVSINGDTAPLTHDVPSVTELVDDGTGTDATAGDGVFSGMARFDVGASKNVLYKFLLNSTYECFGQGDRHVYLNEAEYDTVGGALGPLTLPVARFDRCGTTWAPVEVVFRARFTHTEWAAITPTDVVAVAGTPSNTVPVFDWTVPSLNILADDGVYPDDTAGDLIYAGSIVFPDSNSQFMEFKFLVNDAFECILSNRSFWIDPDGFDAAGNPQILPVMTWGSCDVSDVPVADGLALAQNNPNPFNPSTKISFNLPRDGRTRLRIYNARGEHVKTLRDEIMGAGSHTVIWNGRDHMGATVSSGVYFYRLDAADTALTRRMLLLK
ncbi:MAG: hypothetical protein GY838_14125 [bacterium]|nr:hypothetical protein [bacterium]